MRGGSNRFRIPGVCRLSIVSLLWLCAVCACAQQTPELRLNVMNVCSPGSADREEIAAALARIPAKPVFTSDYEVARGHTMQKKGAADWVRLRREFASQGEFGNVQFMLSSDKTGIDQMLVLHARDSKPGAMLQIALEQMTTAGTAAEVVAADTPPSRIRLERFGQPPVVLARCPGVDQTGYEALFRTAAERFSAYRNALKIPRVIGAELSRLGLGTTPQSVPKASKK